MTIVMPDLEIIEAPTDGEDDDPGISHIFCSGCTGMNRALCGADLTNDTITEDIPPGEQACVVCEDLDEIAHPNCFFP